MNSMVDFTFRIRWWKKKDFRYLFIKGKLTALLRRGDYRIGIRNLHNIQSGIYSITRDILVDVFPVTLKEFSAFIRSGGYFNDDNWTSGTEGRESGGDALLKRIGYSLDRNCHPVTNINWYEAAAYAKWCGKRLLKEKEWEVAAQGTLITKSVKEQGSNVQDLLIKENPYLGENVDGSRLSYIGCAHMLELVREWCDDWYNPNYISDFPMVHGENRCLRGVYFGNLPPPEPEHIASRNRMNPLEYDGRTGFRCCSTFDEMK
jgi:formylglycine-generating enzyme required for sulfatase activity